MKNSLPKHNLTTVVDSLKGAAPHGESAPKIVVLYGSLRANSFSKKLALEVVKMLEYFGADVRLFDPAGLPVFDGESVDHPKVQELRALSNWSEGHVWISPEIHGNLSAVFKNQIDWMPLKQSAVRSTQGKTLAVMQISGGSQSFNAVNSLRILGRWMRMFTIPNQSSIAQAWQEFDGDGKLKDSSYRDRVIDVLEELYKTTLLMRDQSQYLTDRFSEKKSQLLEQGALAEASGAVDKKPSTENRCCSKSAPIKSPDVRLADVKTNTACF